ncbi:unnamed protein product, partial [Nippostrongylus brasiliensis]|uniref:Peptidase A2 domain-containing protein n=1 Tax=Nippostrongylus brasiliensis TaxID=27835 RepID=A0A158R3J8_NIPBR
MSVTDLTEEMLLDSPTDETEGTLMYVNARGPEKPLNQKVIELSKRIQELGRTHDGNVSSAAVDTFADLDPHVLIAIGHQKLRAQEGSVYVGHRRDQERKTPAASNDASQSGAFSAWVDGLACIVSVSEPFQSTGGLFGKKSVTTTRIMDRDVTALLDTGSETSIVPLKIFRKARADGLDLDIHVKRIPGVSAVVRNASGQVMKFLDTIRMPVTWRNRTEDVAFYVGEGLDEIVILGTNALE